MIVLIDGIEYAPKHSAVDKGGKVKSIAKLMLEGRQAKHWTMSQAAERAGVKVNHVIRAECGDVTLATAVTLADVYGIPLEQIARAVRRKQP